MGARAVQETAPPEVPRAARADAARAGATEDDVARPEGEAASPQPKPEKAPPETAAKRANTGPQPTDGNARAETAVVRGQGFGLSSAGGGGGPVQVDVTDFCCPDYLAQLVTFIQRSWDQNQGVVGSTTVKFTIARDGTIQAPLVEKPSGFLALDNSAMRAVQITRLPPLPAAFPNPEPDSSYAIRLSTVIMKNNLRIGSRWLRLESWKSGATSWSVVGPRGRGGHRRTAATGAAAGNHRRSHNSHPRWPSSSRETRERLLDWPFLISSRCHQRRRKSRKRSERSCGTTSTSSKSSTCSPRDTYATIPVARRPDDVPFAAWRELGADAVIFGTVQQSGGKTRCAGSPDQRAIATDRLCQGVFQRQQSTRLRAHDRRRDPSAAARAARSGANETCVCL